MEISPTYPILTQSRLLLSFLLFFEALGVKYPGNILPGGLKTKGRVVGSLRRRLKKQFGLQFEELILEKVTVLTGSLASFYESPEALTLHCAFCTEIIPPFLQHRFKVVPPFFLAVAILH